MPSSVVWVEVELSWDWVEFRLSWSWNWVETELGKYLNFLIKVFKVFNWSFWSSLLLLSLLGGWFGGWVAGIAGNKANLSLSLSWVELRLSLAIYMGIVLSSLLWIESHFTTILDGWVGGRVAGWVGGWVAGWICLRIKLTSAWVEVELSWVELRLSLAIMSDRQL